MSSELENSPPAISAGTSPEAAEALKAWHKRYMTQVQNPIKRLPKPMFSSVEDLLAWVKDGGEIIAKEKGKPEKKNVDEVPEKITWTKPTPEGGVFTFVEFRFAADIEREKEEAKKKPRPMHVPKKGKEAAFKWVCLAMSSDETRPAMNLIAIAPNGDVYASDGHRAHHSFGVFAPSEGWRGIDKKGVEVPFKEDEYANIDAYMRDNGPFARSFSSSTSLFTTDIGAPKAARIDCILSEGFLEKIAAMQKVAKKTVGKEALSVHADNGLVINKKIYDFEWGGIALPATAGVEKTGGIDVKYLLDACAGFATVKWPVEYREVSDENPNVSWDSIGPAHFKNVHGEALVMPVRR